MKDSMDTQQQDLSKAQPVELPDSIQVGPVVAPGHTLATVTDKIGWLSADGSVIYRALDLKVGLFRDAEAQAAGG